MCALPFSAQGGLSRRAPDDGLEIDAKARLAQGARNHNGLATDLAVVGGLQNDDRLAFVVRLLEELLRLLDVRLSEHLGPVCALIWPSTSEHGDASFVVRWTSR